MTNRLNRAQIAWRAAQDLQEGMYVNLGIGMPVLVADFAPADREIRFQSENGIIGVGPRAAPGHEDPDLVDAGSQRVTLQRGAVIVDSTASFAMIRGGHLDVTLLGGFEVAQNGDLANWDPATANKGQLVGGAMDLAAGTKSVRVMMQHVTKTGAPRLVQRCTLPLTGRGVVDRIYTDMAVIDVTDNGFVVREMIDGMTDEQLRAQTGAELQFDARCAVLCAPQVE